MNTFGKHYTHSLSFNECAVVSDKVVSARKEGRSAHVEISKIEGKKEQRPNPNHATRERMPVSIFTDMQTRARTFPTLQFSQASLSWSLSFLPGLLSLASGLDFLLCWSCMAPAGLTRRESSPLSGLNAPIGLFRRRCFASVLMSPG